MGANDLQERLSFLNWTEEDRERLLALRPLFEKNADDLVEAFYRHLLAFPSTRGLLKDPQVKRRLLDAQRSYLLSLADPSLDGAYLAERRSIGETHERIGLEPRWYLGAYSLYASLLLPVICRSLDHDPDAAHGAVVSLQKLLNLDAQIAMEAYIDRHSRELEYLTEELASEGRRLARDYEDQTQELRSTEHRARAAEELAAVGTLVAGLAHEIGTPMGVIQGHAKLLEGKVSDDSARWRLRTIQEQITRISRIIQTLLNLARPQPTQRTPVELAPLVEATLSFLQEKLRRREIRVETDLADASSILGDRERLQQLFFNLFINAADAMPNGGELRVHIAPADDDVIELRVADSGVGIAPEVREHVFDPFYTTKPAGEGNGLGLMVAKGIVSDHGGTIEIEPGRAEGTEFVLRFPEIRLGAGSDS